MPLYRVTWRFDTSGRKSTTSMWFMDPFGTVQAASLTAYLVMQEIWLRTDPGVTHGINEFYRTTVELDQSVTEQIGPDGRPVGLPHVVTESLIGDSSDGQLPLQTSVLVTLYTELRGRQGWRGMWWPSPATNALRDTSRLTAACQERFRDGYVRAMTVAESRGAVIGIPVYAEGTVRPFTRISVGDLPDTQRRRIADIPENRLVGETPW